MYSVYMLDARHVASDLSGLALRNAILVSEDEKLSEMWRRLKEWTTMSADSKALVPVSR